MKNNRICIRIDINKLKYFDLYSIVYNYNLIKFYLLCRLY